MSGGDNTDMHKKISKSENQQIYQQPIPVQRPKLLKNFSFVSFINLTTGYGQTKTKTALFKQLQRSGLTKISQAQSETVLGRI